MRFIAVGTTLALIMFLALAGFSPSDAVLPFIPEFLRWDKGLHLFGFALLTASVYMVWELRRPWMNAVVTAVIVGSMAILSEIVQAFFPSHVFDEKDIGANFLGITAGLLIMLPLDTYLLRPYFASRKHRRGSTPYSPVAGTEDDADDEDLYAEDDDDDGVPYDYVADDDDDDEDAGRTRETAGGEQRSLLGGDLEGGRRRRRRPRRRLRVGAEQGIPSAEVRISRLVQSTDEPPASVLGSRTVEAASSGIPTTTRPPSVPVAPSDAAQIWRAPSPSHHPSEAWELAARGPASATLSLAAGGSRDPPPPPPPATLTIHHDDASPTSPTGSGLASASGPRRRSPVAISAMLASASNSASDVWAGVGTAEEGRWEGVAVRTTGGEDALEELERAFGVAEGGGGGEGVMSKSSSAASLAAVWGAVAGGEEPKERAGLEVLLGGKRRKGR
ncbi:hypothetical protein HDU96_006852 [Phlyctochytrium bullatum]|nr:hypothetical protein HDU96_006852 [Phlyctochytrium bullatum]